ncbi:MAG: cyclopropane-fatty-acyl-phospholipid synthase [Alphaproteobacteria bacterium RIFCSPLOWO2_01_FULL_45_8]|nr:MAG: cyclopropane-fatty-acyl-phospholipid synthase [Alphaproteobacteria bacterium RIFCSPLOWO2_01_FULL_45_8]
MLLAAVLKRFIQQGTLHVIDAAGKKHTFSGTPGPEATIRLHAKSIELKMMLNPDIALGEGYTEGEITVEEGTLAGLLDVCTRNLALHPLNALTSIVEVLCYPLRFIFQHNSLTGSRKNVSHHYDLNGKLYKLFLDKDMQYSCAYFKKLTDSLEIAQENKKKHIAKKLCLQKGQKVLDIGSGWGGLALFLAKSAGVEVTGLTLSEEQLKVSRERAKAAGLDHRVKFFLRDYREEKGKYDRIVSVGMFEHVGTPNYNDFFHQVHDLLTPQGMAVLHSIGKSSVPGNAKGWISKYIFPGGYCPSLSEVMGPIENSKLFVTDIEILRYHYAETLKHWRERFQEKRDQAQALYDARFCRLWDYYLTSCEMAFRNLGFMVFQIQLMRDPRLAPLTREYMYEGSK